MATGISSNCKDSSCVSVSRYPPQRSADGSTGGTTDSASAKSSSKAQTAANSRQEEPESFDFIVSPNPGMKGGAALQVALVFRLDRKKRAAAELVKSLQRAIQALSKDSPGFVDVQIPVPSILLRPTPPKGRQPKVKAK